MHKKLVMAVALLFLTAPFFITIKQVSAVTQNSWTSRMSMPTARTDLGTAVVKGKIFAIGGGNHDGNLSTNEMYDPVKDTWTTKASMPTSRSSFGIAVYQNKIYCIGGSTSEGVTEVNEVYDPETDTWETKTSMPTARSGLEANVVGGKIYLIGGSTGGSRGTVNLNEVYDPANDSWSTAQRLPTAVQGYSSAVVDDKIFVIGGYNYKLSYVDSTQIYDPAGDTWINGVPIPLSSGVYAAAATTGVFAPKRIYVIGGGQLIPGNRNFIYDTQADAWSLGTNMPTARNSLSVAVVDDMLYAIGGDRGGYFTILSANEQYTPFGYGTVSPEVAVVSPENGNYTSGDVSLAFTVNKPAVWLGYSLDGQDNVTVTGNVTLSGLSSGLHNVTVYAEDEFGNMGVSETVCFTIAAPEPFPVAPVAAASAATVAVVGVGLLVYFKKRKTMNGN
jgi:ribosomal protein S8